MAIPVNTNSSQYPLTLQRHPDNRSSIELPAQELAEYVIPILRHHTAGLIIQRHAISSLGVATDSGFRNAQNHANQLERRVDTLHETLSFVNRRVTHLNARLADQTEEIRRLRNLPCNRLQRAASALCTYL